MNTAVRDELAGAARAFFEAEPWKRVSDSDLFGVRDEASGITAFASVLGAGGGELGLTLCLGPGGFSILERVKAGGRVPAEVLYEADVLSLCALKPGEAAAPRELSLGTAGHLRLWAFRKPRAERMRAPAEPEMRLLARVLLAVAKQASAGNLAPARPGQNRREIPFLVLTGKGKRIRTAWARGEPSLARLVPRRQLFVPHPLRRALAARPAISPWIATVAPAPAAAGRTPIPMFVVYDPREGRVLHAEPFAGDGAIEEAGRALLRALAGSGPSGSCLGRPVEISTDSSALAEFVAYPLGRFGIRVQLRHWVSGLEEVRQGLAAILEGKGAEPARPGSGSGLPQSTSAEVRRA